MHLLLCSWFLLLSGGLLALALNPWPRLALKAGSGLAAAGSFLGLLAAVLSLMGDAPLTMTLPLAMPGASFALVMDGLGAFFLIPIFLIGLAGAVYGQEYMAESKQWPGLHWLFYNLLILAMALVVTAANGVLFLFAWECMSLTSFFLVIADHRDGAVARAGLIYLLATHLGAALLFIFFLVAGAKADSLDFAAFTVLQTISPTLAAILFALLAVGFGSKAGLFPFHVWLPEAHPAAPSHVSALMSGVMVKTAIYGLLRMLSFLPPPPAWWGGVLLTLGLIGALFGIAMAAGQKDLKRGLAYSTVENVGLIFVALGFWLYSRASHHPLAAQLALYGGLLHLWNHALFKSLLFLGAGSLVHGSGTRNLNRMGGLLKRMPRSGMLLVVGAMAVMALPPFNGLVGEWFIYRALLETGVRLTGLDAFFPLIVLGLMAVVGGMVLMVFTRLIGIALCGEPRQAGAAAAHEVGWRMLAPMAVLALLCLAPGLVPAMIIVPVSRVARLIDPTSLGVLAKADLLPLWLGGLGWGVLALVSLAVVASRWLQAKNRTTAAPTWGCGYAFATSRMAYSAEGFTELAATGLFSKGLQPTVADGRSLGLFPEPALFSHQAPDLVLDGVFQPLFDRLAGVCLRCRHLQSGLVHTYVAYIFMTTLLLLAWVAWW
jgi:formate hydrogenlyase subunit 3/multisubunit Na+/H+ antiporter MnhD subunit